MDAAKIARYPEQMKRTTRLALLAAAGTLLAAVGLASTLKSSKHGGFRTAEAADSGSAYTVSMSPMGPVTFKHVPRRVVTQDPNYNDMLTALGEGKKLVGTGFANNDFHLYYNGLPAALAQIDFKALTLLSKTGIGYGIDKETLYALHADVHHIDPKTLEKTKGWTKDDVDEIARNVGPFFANRFSRDDNYVGAGNYDYYDVWQLSGKVAQVYQQPRRIAKLKELFDEMVARIQAKLPPVAERPRVAVLLYQKSGFLAFLQNGGFGAEQYRAVGAVDAFATVKVPSYKEGPSAARLDLEGMLSIDPDVIITNFAVNPGMRQNHELLLGLKSDPLAMRIKAFKNNRLYPGGTPLQGPIFLIFQTEMAAKQIYPTLFGNYRDDQDYPKEEQLFDRAKLEEILTDDPEGAGK